MSDREMLKMIIFIYIIQQITPLISWTLTIFDCTYFEMQPSFFYRCCEIKYYHAVRSFTVYRENLGGDHWKGGGGGD